MTLKNFCFVFYLSLTSPNQAEASEIFYQPNRYYDSKTCQFISPDTVVPNPLKSQALNHYAYTYNNPLKYTDPSGHVPVGDGWIDRIINAFFGGGSKPPPSGYRGSIGGDSRASYMSERAWKSQKQNQATTQLAAGAAVAAREVEFKTGVSLIAGSADFFYYADPFTYSDSAMHNNGELRPPSESLFVVVDLDLQREPGYKIPYYGGAAAGAGFVVIPAALALKYGLAPKSLPTPNLRPSPRPRNPPYDSREAPDIGPRLPPVIVGGAPGRINFNSPTRYARLGDGVLIHEFHRGDLTGVTMLRPGDFPGDRTRVLNQFLYRSGVEIPGTSSSERLDAQLAGDVFNYNVERAAQTPGGRVVTGITGKGVLNPISVSDAKLRASNPYEF